MYFTDHRPKPMTNRRDLHTTLTQKVTKPDALSVAEYGRLSENARGSYDADRVRYASAGLTVRTPQVRTALKILDKLVDENSGRIGTQSGLLISGAAGFGKTTVLKTLMRHTNSEYDKYRRDAFAEGLTPIAFIEAPAGGTPKNLVQHLCTFSGLPIARTETLASIQARLVDTMNATDTRLLVVDELHNLNARTAANGDTVDVLRSLHNQVPATFVYAGLNLIGGKLLTGPKGAQITARSTQLQMTHYAMRKPAQRKEWHTLVSTFEKALPLVGHEPGQLATHADRLAELCNGSLGELSQMLTGLAIERIRSTDTDETITLDHIQGRATLATAA
jgi:hypothetical protein